MLRFFSYSVVKLPEATQISMMVDHVKEMTVKESCEYSEYGLFEHLLFFFFFLLDAIKVRAATLR